MPPKRSAPAGPFARPLDRAVIALREEFGHDTVVAVWRDGDPHAERWTAVCPLHALPGETLPLTLRERGGHGGSLVLDCELGCLPSAILAELRSLERWQLLRNAGVEA